MASDDEKRKFVDIDSDVDADDEKSPLIDQSRDSPSSSRSASPEPGEDPRFNPPAPSMWKRLSLLIFISFLFWAGFQLRAGLLEAKKNPKIIYASRYSKEYKFRPAASPVITETLKDGRIRLRGAVAPSATPTPSPVAEKKKKKKIGTGSVSGKRKGGKAKSKGKGSSSTGKRM